MNNKVICNWLAWAWVSWTGAWQGGEDCCGREPYGTSDPSCLCAQTPFSPGGASGCPWKEWEAHIFLFQTTLFPFLFPPNLINKMTLCSFILIHLNLLDVMSLDSRFSGGPASCRGASLPSDPEKWPGIHKISTLLELIRELRPWDNHVDRIPSGTGLWREMVGHTHGWTFHRVGHKVEPDSSLLLRNWTRVWKCPHKRTSSLGVCTGELTKHLRKKTNSTPAIPENRRRDTYQVILWGLHYCGTKIIQRRYKKIKL